MPECVIIPRKSEWILSVADMYIVFIDLGSRFFCEEWLCGLTDLVGSSEKLRRREDSGPSRPLSGWFGGAFGAKAEALAYLRQRQKTEADPSLLHPNN